jgi:hypothetical protein
MNLCECFARASLTNFENVNSLEKQKPYCLKGAERLQTKCGLSVLLTIRTTSTDTARVFLPKRFTLVLSEVDIDLINNRMIKIYFLITARAKKLIPICSL